MTDALDIAELERLHREATPEPWRSMDGDSVVNVVSAESDPIAATTSKAYYERHDATDKANAALIVALRNHLPAILAKLKACEDYERICADPAAVHLNMLRGGIAKPSRMSLLHLAGCTDYDHLKERLEATEKALAGTISATGSAVEDKAR